MTERCSACGGEVRRGRSFYLVNNVPIWYDTRDCDCPMSTSDKVVYSVVLGGMAVFLLWFVWKVVLHG